jgi:signal transduction histidine kinase
VFNPEKINLKDLVFNIMNLFSEVIVNKEINIVNEIPDDQFLVADKNMLSTILRNLISNAIKFTPNGKSIKISVANMGDNIKISVQDEGTGIQEEDLPKLFNSLSPLSSYGTQGEKGSGLGLLLCKDFIDRHNGIIEVNSIWGKGSTFSFTLPQATK